MLQRMMGRFQKLVSIFWLDMRAIGLFRFFLGSMVVVDLLVRMTALEAHYSDSGLFPRHLYAEGYLNSILKLTYFVTGDSSLIALVFLVNIFAAIALAIGFHGRVFSLVCFVMLSSLHERAPYILQGGDVLLRVMLLWASFLPLDRYYALRSVRCEEDKSFADLRAAGLILQFVMMYWFSVFLKSGEAWISDGSAVYYALNIDEMAKAPAEWFREKFVLTQVATYATLIAEALCPLALFLPSSFYKWRAAAVIGLMVMHIAFGSFLTLGLFSPIVITGLIAFLPLQEILSTKLFTTWSQNLQKWNLFFATMGQKRFAPVIDPSSCRVKPSHLIALQRCLCLGLIGLVFISNLIKGKEPPPPDSSLVLSFVKELGVDQHWGLFAPMPTQTSMHPLIQGYLADGSPFDLWQGKSGFAPAEDPERTSDIFPNPRWRKYFEFIFSFQDRAHLKSLSSFWCRKGSSQTNNNENPVKHVEIYFAIRPTLLPPATAHYKKELIWKQNCANDEFIARE
jgi:hypothetical protein